MMYAANYLFCTHGVRWALDPLLPGGLLPELRERLPTRALRRLSFVLLTHDHADHADYDLLAGLADSPVCFVAPEQMRAKLIERAGPREAQLIAAKPGEWLEIDGIGVLPFEGLHWRTHPDGQHAGIDAVGYLVEVGDRRWLFPGDVRDYRAEAVAPFAPVDTLFAHLWLGRGRALDETPPELDTFCRFMLAAGPEEIVLTHLHEFSRPPRDLWSRRHVELVRARFHALGCEAPIHALRTGQGLELS